MDPCHSRRSLRPLPIPSSIDNLVCLGCAAMPRHPSSQSGPSHLQPSPVLHSPQGVTAAPPPNIVAWLASVAAAVAVGIFIGSGPPQASQLQAPSIPPMLQGTAAQVVTPGKLLPAGSSPEASVPDSKDITLNSTMTMQTPAPAELLGFGVEELRTIKIFQDSTPCVVNVTNLQEVRNAVTNDLLRVPRGMGSGFLWDAQGTIVTNNHVVQGAVEVTVTLLDQSTYKAVVVGRDADKDVAVLRLTDVPPEKMAEFKPVRLGDSAGLQVGQKVFAIGNPFGLDHTMTSGIISGLGRELNTGVYTIKNVIQSDAAINPGNSGGILLDSRGNVVGINTAIADPTGKGASSGVGFAIPIDSVKGLVGQILEFGRVVRPAMGIVLAPPQALMQLNKEGVLVLDVPSGSPARKAGIQATVRQGNMVILGDIIVAVDSSKVKDYTDLQATLGYSVHNHYMELAATASAAAAGEV
ncbi:MAG: hypothetical protein WDW38_000730 [Sanguina aurantia]